MTQFTVTLTEKDSQIITTPLLATTPRAALDEVNTMLIYNPFVVKAKIERVITITEDCPNLNRYIKYLNK